MNRRDFIRKVIYCGGIGFVCNFLGFSNSNWTSAAYETGEDRLSFENEEYYRIIVLGDPHLPVKYSGQDLIKQQKIIDAKNKIIEDINSWKDVKQIHVLGDIVARVGVKAEYEYAKDYFDRFNKPVFFISGNHDYIYESLSADGKYIRGDANSRLLKLNLFKDTFRLNSLFYSQKIGRYLMVFLSVDSVESDYLTQMSDLQIDWFRHELEANSQMPTLVFFHAPLVGTLLSYNKRINTPNFIANPQEQIADIINSNQQIVLWVSGHTHTPAVNLSYCSSINAFNDHVTNIHNSDMDRQTIWTNSIYLYQDKISIRTFNHEAQRWEREFDRVFLT